MARLIDADALRERYEVVDPAGTFSYCDWIMDTIDKQPTIEAIPVEWLREWQDEVGTLNEWWPIIERIITVWREEQEAR